MMNAPAIIPIIPGKMNPTPFVNELIPRAPETMERVDIAFTGFQIPFCVLTAIAAIIWLFMT